MDNIESMMRHEAIVRLHHTTLWHPDSAPPAEKRPPNFFCQITRNAIGFISPHSHILLPLAEEDHEILLSAAHTIAASNGESVGSDAAMGSNITHLTTEISWLYVQKHSTLTFNHSASYRESEPTTSHALISTPFSLLSDSLAPY
ncbi:MAG TPA: hypothetical protein PLU30_12725 [Verrucomicrobiae bacterium]|nr:hypothetical protein [Verrucomicrobiae bacterium]